MYYRLLTADQRMQHPLPMSSDRALPAILGLGPVRNPGTRL
jgi:hypothetical protein